MNLLQAIAPTDLRDFLKASGWNVRMEGLADRLYVLENPRFASRQLVYPMDIAAPDYVDSVGSVIGKLSDLLAQSPASLVSRVESVRDDVLRLRIAYGEHDAALPLSFAAAAVSNTEKLLKSAACTVLRPRVHHPRLTLSEASQFVEKSRFGQTENGSFVMKVACPMNAMEVQGSLDLGDETAAPFVRQVTLALRRGLTLLADAIEADTLSALVDGQRQAASPLVSSNLCEALAGMHDEQIDNSLDIAFEWSALRSVPAGDARGMVRFQRDYFARVEEVRRELRRVETETEDSFIGTVERLDGEMGADNRRSGGVVLSLLLPDEGESVRARLVLNADHYEQADRAHMTNGAYVRVTGRLQPGRQPRQLTDVSRFEMLQPLA